MSVAVGSGHVLGQVLAAFILLKSCIALLQASYLSYARVRGTFPSWFINWGEILSIVASSNLYEAARLLDLLDVPKAWGAKLEAGAADPEPLEATDADLEWETEPETEQETEQETEAASRLKEL